MAEYPRRVERCIREKRPGVFEVRVHVRRDSATGDVVQLSETTTDGIKAAQRIRTELEKKAAKSRTSVGGSTLLEVAIAEYIEQARKMGRAERTINEYRRRAAVITQDLGDIPIEKLRTHAIQNWFGDLRQAGASQAMLREYLRFIRAVLNACVRWEWLDRSPADGVRMGQVPKFEPAVPSPERVVELIRAAGASRAVEMDTIITFAALSGLRRGELCGIRWCDVDWKRRSIMVAHSIWQIGKESGIKDPKAHQKKKVKLGPLTMSVLADRFVRAQELADGAGATLGSRAYVFSRDPDGKRWVLPDTITQAFGRLCRSIEKPGRALAESEDRDMTEDEAWPHRFQDLRHYGATELDRAGFEATTIADRLRHQSAETSRKFYIHTREDLADEAAAYVEGGLAIALPGGDS